MEIELSPLTSKGSYVSLRPSKSSGLLGIKGREL
jgi:hypothetical protein